MEEQNIFDMIRSEDLLIKQKYDILLMKAMIPFGYYTLIYEGMGCSSYIRNRRGKLEAIFFHNDDSFFPLKIEKIKKFIKKYKLIETYIIHDWTLPLNNN